MAESPNFICSNCEHETTADNEFCTNCGSLFDKSVKCINHENEEAEGACIICANAYCSECGSWVNNIFLCTRHEEYEIYEGMARIFGTSDDNLAQYAQKCLEQEGFHPYLYSRKVSPISLGGPDYTLFRASGEYDGHIINEVKVMVPCQEVIKAEKVLRELEIIND
jgi:hypothetical protein